MNLSTIALAAMVALAVTLAGCAALPPPQAVKIASGQISYVQQGSIKPVVILQAGLGDGKDGWAPLMEALPPTTAVFAYDRPGYGDSASTDAPRDPCAIATELHEILRAAGVAPPYLLVGHSLGGLYQYVFAKLYPNEVAAILLLDPTHPDHWATMQQQAPGASAIVSGLRQTVFAKAARREFDAQADCNDRLSLLKAPTVPMKLLARANFELVELGAFQNMVRVLEKDWLALLPGMTRKQVDGAGHYLQRDRPDVVAQQIRLLQQLSAAPTR